MSDPSPSLFIAFRSADTISEEDVRDFLEQFGPNESLSVPKRKEGESRLCFVTYMSETKATEIMNAIIDGGMSVKGERPMVRYNNNQKDNRRKTTGPFIGGGGGGFGNSSGSAGFANGSGNSGAIGFDQRRDESRFGSQSSLNRSAIAAGGGDAHRPASRSSGSSQFYANKDLDLSRLVIRVDTASGVRHIECQPDCFNLMKQFMTPDELDSGIRAYAVVADTGANRQQQQQQPSPLVPVPIHAEPTAPIRSNGQHTYNGGGALSSNPKQQQQQAQMPPPPPPIAQAAAAAVVSASPAALVSNASSAATAPSTAAPAAAPLTKQRFEPRRLAPGTRIQAKLIEFDSVSQFTAVDSAMADRYFQQIENLLNRFYNSAGQQPAGQPVPNPKPGDCVCSVWSNDGKYYRTVVREAVGPRLANYGLDCVSRVAWLLGL